MAGCCSRGLVGGWILLYALVLLAMEPSPSPVETMSRLVSISATICDCSWLRAHAQCLYLLLSVLYVVAAVGVMHGTCIGTVLAVLVSLISALTFDNPLLSDIKHDGREALLVAHIIIIVAVLTLSCSANSTNSPALTESKDPKKVDEPQESKEQKEDKEPKGGKGKTGTSGKKQKHK